MLCCAVQAFLATCAPSVGQGRRKVEEGDRVLGGELLCQGVATAQRREQPVRRHQVDLRELGVCPGWEVERLGAVGASVH